VWEKFDEEAQHPGSGTKGTGMKQCSSCKEYIVIDAKVFCK